MAVNKVVLGEDTLIDLTGDTVSADKLAKGTTAHNMAGEPIVGTMEAGGVVPDNMVTTDTDQTITGNKTMSSIKMRTNTSDIRDYLGQTMLIGNGINTFIGHRDHPNGKTIIRGVNRPMWQNNSTTIDIATTDQITTVEANPENPTQTLSSIKIGDIDYSVGGGSSGYTFTNGLTESSGTVSWDLNDRIISKSGSILQITSDASSGQLNIQAGPSRLGVGTIMVTNNGNNIFLKPKISGSQVMLDSENKTLSPYNSPLLNLGSASNKWNNGYFAGDILANNIPAPPSADGEYNLHCSIVSGVPTYTWKAE